MCSKGGEGEVPGLLPVGACVGSARKAVSETRGSRFYIIPGIVSLVPSTIHPISFPLNCQLSPSFPFYFSSVEKLSQSSAKKKEQNVGDVDVEVESEAEVA